MIMRVLGPQGIAGLAASFCLALLLLLQKGETRHWREESARFEQRFREAQSAHQATVANYRAAADAARAADQARLARVANEQRAINERIENEFEARLAAARAAGERLRLQAAAGATHSRAGGGASMSGPAAPASGVAHGSAEDRLSAADALIATEQAIQLDALIKWVTAQAEIDTSSPPTSR